MADYEKICINCNNSFKGIKSRIFCSRKCSGENTTKIHNLKISLHKGKLYCNVCDSYKLESLFYKSKLTKPIRNGRENRCKDCNRIIKAKNKYNKNEDLEQCIRYMLNRTKARSKLFDSLNRDSNYDLTKENLIEKFNNQKGFCAISGRKMTCFVGGRGRLDDNLSIDRINSNFGYVISNIQLVCDRVNIMKGNLSMKELIVYAQDIISKNEK